MGVEKGDYTHKETGEERPSRVIGRQENVVYTDFPRQESAAGEESQPRETDRRLLEKIRAKLAALGGSGKEKKREITEEEVQNPTLLTEANEITFERLISERKITREHRQLLDKYHIELSIFHDNLSEFKKARRSYINCAQAYRLGNVTRFRVNEELEKYRGRYTILKGSSLRVSELSRKIKNLIDSARAEKK